METNSRRNLRNHCNGWIDQDLMQKNLSCANIKEAQKHVFFTGILSSSIFSFFFLSGSFALFVPKKKWHIGSNGGWYKTHRFTFP